MKMWRDENEVLGANQDTVGCRCGEMRARC